MRHFIRAGIVAVALASAMTACTQSRVNVYKDIVDPMVGTSKRDDVDRVLGRPATCSKEQGFEMCEYRTNAARNESAPITTRMMPGWSGPDVSPYENFDVLHLFYDDFGVLKEWDPIVVKP